MYTMLDKKPPHNDCLKMDGAIESDPGRDGKLTWTQTAKIGLRWRGKRILGSIWGSLCPAVGQKRNKRKCGYDNKLPLLCKRSEQNVH